MLQKEDYTRKAECSEMTHCQEAGNRKKVGWRALYLSFEIVGLSYLPLTQLLLVPHLLLLPTKTPRRWGISRFVSRKSSIFEKNRNVCPKEKGDSSAAAAVGWPLPFSAASVPSDLSQRIARSWGEWLGLRVVMAWDRAPRILGHLDTSLSRDHRKAPLFLHGRFRGVLTNGPSRFWVQSQLAKLEKIWFVLPQWISLWERMCDWTYKINLNIENHHVNMISSQKQIITVKKVFNKENTNSSKVE